MSKYILSSAKSTLELDFSNASGRRVVPRSGSTIDSAIYMMGVTSQILVKYHARARARQRLANLLTDINSCPRASTPLKLQIRTAQEKR